MNIGKPTSTLIVSQIWPTEHLLDKNYLKAYLNEMSNSHSEQ